MHVIPSCWHHWLPWNLLFRTVLLVVNALKIVSCKYFSFSLACFCWVHRSRLTAALAQPFMAHLLASVLLRSQGSYSLRLLSCPSFLSGCCLGLISVFDVLPFRSDVFRHGFVPKIPRLRYAMLPKSVGASVFVIISGISLIALLSYSLSTASFQNSNQTHYAFLWFLWCLTSLSFFSICLYFFAEFWINSLSTCLIFCLIHWMWFPFQWLHFHS